MRLPYLQVATDLIEHAPDLAVELGISEEKAGWGLVRLIQWALSRCPDDAPPSTSAVVPGAAAAKLIARAASYKGDPERFVDACCSLKPKAILERCEGGIRVRGLDRYDEAWRTSQSRSNKAKKAAEARWGARAGGAPAVPSNNAPPMLGGCSADAPGLPQHAQTQTQTQTQTQRDSKAEAPPPENSAPPAPEQPDQPPAPSEGLAFFEWGQAERKTTLKVQPQELTTRRDREAWDKAYRAAKDAAAEAKLEIQDVWLQFLCDEWAQQRAPACPWQAFASRPVLERCISRVLELQPPSPPAPPCAKCRERASETEVWGFRVCYPCLADWERAVPDTETETQAATVAWIQAGRAA